MGWSHFGNAAWAWTDVRAQAAKDRPTWWSHDSGPTTREGASSGRALPVVRGFVLGRVVSRGRVGWVVGGRAGVAAGTGEAIGRFGGGTADALTPGRHARRCASVCSSWSARVAGLRAAARYGGLGDAQVAEWQTRTVQVRVPGRGVGFNSPGTLGSSRTAHFGFPETPAVGSPLGEAIWPESRRCGSLAGRLPPSAGTDLVCREARLVVPGVRSCSRLPRGWRNPIQQERMSG